MGMELHGSTAGVVGTGKIGAIVARILLGFGCRVLAYDVFPNSELEAAGIVYVSATISSVRRTSSLCIAPCNRKPIISSTKTPWP